MPNKPLKTTKKKSFWRWVGKLLLYAFISSFLYALLLKWVYPPITITQLVSLVEGDGLKRDYVAYHNISPNYKLAAIASEDQLFPDHSGFDWKSLEKSVLTKPKKKNKKRGAGASTISQQVAKNVFLWQGSGIFRHIRKIPEAYFTLLIEWLWGKERILDVYLNVIEMGQGVYGAEAASQFYFKKSAKNVSKNEAATVIACLPNPKKFTVIPRSKFVQWKSQKILKQMKNIASDDDVHALCQ